MTKYQGKDNSNTQNNANDTDGSLPDRPRAVLDVPFDGRVPWSQHITMSIQNVFAITGMFLFPAILGIALHLPPQRLAELYGATFVVTGLGTILQAVMGLKLPIVLGPWAATLAALIEGGKVSGLGTAFGSLFVAAVIWAILSLPIRGLSVVGFVGRAFRDPIMYGGITIMAMTALTSVTVVNWIGTPFQRGFGAANWVGGAVAIIVTFLVIVFTKGFLRSAAMICGIIIGTLAYQMFVPIKFTGVSKSAWIVIPRIFAFGFSVSWLLVILFLIVILASVASSLALYNLAAQWADETLQGRRMAWGIFGQSLTSIVAAIFGTFTTTVYPDNLGIVRTSRIGSRWITFTTGIILVCGGFVLKFDEIFVSIPSNVIAAAAVVLFGVIAMSGVEVLGRVKWDQLNYLVLGVPLMLSLGGLFVAPATMVHYPLLAREIITDPFLTGPVLLIVLHLVINKVVRPMTSGELTGKIDG